jgi:hypothetical protein
VDENAAARKEVKLVSKRLVNQVWQLATDEDDGEDL